MVGLTPVYEGSGSLSKLQTVHGLHRLRSCYPWGCRIPENKTWNRLNKSLQVCTLAVHGMWTPYIV